MSGFIAPPPVAGAAIAPSTVTATGVITGAGLQSSADPGAGVAAQTGFTSATGLGNGAQTAVTSPLIGTGTGPANGQVVTNFIKVYIGAAVRWIPVMS